MPRVYSLETLTALREADLRYYDALRAADQRALQIRQEAEKVALDLAREIQTYKDEKANELRAQINSERGLYPTKADLSSAIDKVGVEIKPLQDFMVSQLGSQSGRNDINARMLAILVAITAGLAVIAGLIGSHIH